MLEPLPTIVCNSILCAISKATEQQVAANECTSSSFSSVAVDNAHVLRILLQKIKHISANVRKQKDSRAVMILPGFIHYHFLERRVIIDPSAYIVDHVFILVVFVKIAGNVSDIVSVNLLPEVCSWEGHCDDSWRNVSQVK